MRLTAVSPEGARVELLQRLVRYPRPDVAQFFELGAHRIREKIGFICFFELAAPSLLPRAGSRDGGRRGAAVEVAAPTGAAATRSTCASAILDDPPGERLLDEPLMADHVYPAIRRIQERLDAGLAIESVVAVRHAAASARGLDRDPALPAASSTSSSSWPSSPTTPSIARGGPDLRARLARAGGRRCAVPAAELYPIYGVPFRVADAGAERRLRRRQQRRRLARPRPAAAAAELGRAARPRPAGSSTMRDFYDATPNIGALGPKLLYEDDSIQHAGMYFHQPDRGCGSGSTPTTSRACTATFRPRTCTRPCRPSRAPA